MDIIVGIDEVGRGALAGPVVVGAAAVLEESSLRTGLEAALRRGITDSKKLTRLQRERGAAFLTDQVLWSLGEATSAEIDTLGLAKALRLAAERAIAGLAKEHTILKIEADAGLFHPFSEIPTTHTVKGDEHILPITCASILAKVHRDALMHQLAVQYPDYGWESNVGYGSLKHRIALKNSGYTPEHRRSFVVR